MRPARIIALILGIVLLLPALATVIGGLVLAGGYAFARDDDGYFTAELDRLATDTAAISVEDIDILADPDEGADWLLDRLDLDVRLTVTGTAGDEVFIGIAPQEQVEVYLGQLAHDEVVSIDDDEPRYERRGATPGAIAPPGGEDMWVASSSGPGPQQLDWTPEAGTWSVLVANSDGSPGVVVEAEAGVRSGAVPIIAVATVVAGLVMAAVGAVLIIVAVPRDHDTEVAHTWELSSAEHPVTLEADLEPGLSRWLWLVKWLLAIPHLIALAFLWLAFSVLTLVAGISVIFTGNYPRGIFDINVGILRWTWRVAHYAGPGGLGTDRYPAFGLAAHPDDSTRLEIAYPGPMSRGLALVKWWLLAIPHYLILGALLGGGVAADQTGGTGLIGALVLAVGLVLLVTGSYPRGLHDLVVGLNRWVVRVLAYVAFMTDVYPPFRLDQGGREPRSEPIEQTSS